MTCTAKKGSIFPATLITETCETFHDELWSASDTYGIIPSCPF